jgi:hypothetical protein
VIPGKISKEGKEGSKEKASIQVSKKGKVGKNNYVLTLL